MLDFSSDLKTGVSFDESLPLSFAESDYVSVKKL
jgi:hypothetical protein